MEFSDDLPMLDLPLDLCEAAFLSSGELDQILFGESQLQPFTTEQPFAPQQQPQPQNVFEPQLAFRTEQPFALQSQLFPTEVINIQQKLLCLREEELLANADLENIAKYIDYFTNEELNRIPNVWCKGQGAAAGKAACEQMIMLKMVSCQVGIALSTVIKPFLTHEWCACKCSNLTGSRKDQKCARERCPGSLACSRHSKVVLSVSQYLAL